MPTRSMPQVPTLTTPVYADMNARLESARAVWDRQRDMLCTQQAISEPAQQPMPFAAADYQPLGTPKRESELDRLVREVIVMIVAWVTVLAVGHVVRATS